MKRIVMLAALASVVAAVGAVPGGAQTSTRGLTERVTASTTPKRDRLRPYTFTTRGRVIPPNRYCNPGEIPRSGAGNCIPVRCAAGTTDPRYCVRPQLSAICSGTVNVRVQKRNTTISSKNVGLRPDCTFQSRLRLNSRLPTRRGVLRVRARFQGNAVLQPRNSSSHTVRAG